MISPSPDRVVVVAGGGTPTGFRIALALVLDGVRVALVDDRGAEENAEALGGETRGIRADASSESAMAAALDRVVADLGRLDGIVIHTGEPSATGRARRGNHDDRTRALSVTMRRNIAGTAAAIPHLRRRARSSIVNVGPVVEARGDVGGKPYCAEHIVVIGLSRSDAAKYRDLGVRVNAVLPVDDHPDLGRHGVPHDLTAAVAHLCRRDPGDLTGHTVPVVTGFPRG